MRSLEYLIQLFPNKTGMELKAIQEQDKQADEAEEKQRNATKIAFMEDINENGGYYRGTFGLNQKYMYRCFNVELHDGELYMSVEKIVIFSGPDYNNGEFSAERRIETYEKVENYGLDWDDRIKRVTAKEFGEVSKYLENVSKFWR